MIRIHKKTLLDIINTSDEDLSRLRNMGKKCMQEIAEKRDALVAEILARNKIDDEEASETATKHLSQVY